MHTYTLVKLHAKDAKTAQEEVEQLMYETCGDGKLFDYASVDVMTLNDEEKARFQVETFEELEAKYKQHTEEALTRGKEKVHEEMKLLLMKKYMQPEEAALLINDGDHRFESAAQEILKNGGGEVLPKNLTEMGTSLADMLLDSIGDWGCMLLYVLKSYATLHSAVECPDEFYTAADSPDNHFISLEAGEDIDQDKNDPIFYCLVDRHY